MPANVDIFHPLSNSGKQVSPIGELSCLKGWCVIRSGAYNSRASALINFKSGGSGGTTLFSYEAPLDEGDGSHDKWGSPQVYINAPGLGVQFDSGIYVEIVITATGGGVVDGFLIHTVYT